MEKKRCPWSEKDQLYMDYHDKEWGTPNHDDRHLFEMLNLEGAQAGLSWYTILTKRENYRKAFDNWDAKKIIQYDEARIASLLDNPGIVRNKLKINSVIKNAHAFLAVQQAFGSFDKYIWSFVGGQPLLHHRKNLQEVPASTAVSDVMSKDLQQRGFKFVGSTICYAFMQATGMVDDHLITCWKHHKKH